MEGNSQFIELHKLLESKLWKAKKRWNLFHDDVIKSICVVASDAVSNTQLPEEFDAPVTIIAKTLLVGLRGSLAPFRDGLKVNFVTDSNCLVWLKLL